MAMDKKFPKGAPERPPAAPDSIGAGRRTKSGRYRIPEIPRKKPPAPEIKHHDEHEGATEKEVGDRTGPGAGYDEEPKKAD